MKNDVSENYAIEKLTECQKILSKYGINFQIQDILSPDRSKDLVYKRALIVSLLKARGYSLVKIAGIINRDHTNVIHLLNNYTKRTQGFNKDFIKIISRINKISAKEEINQQIMNHKELVLLHKNEILRLKRELKQLK